MIEEPIQYATNNGSVTPTNAKPPKFPKQRLDMSGNFRTNNDKKSAYNSPYVKRIDNGDKYESRSNNSERKINKRSSQNLSQRSRNSKSKVSSKDRMSESVHSANPQDHMFATRPNGFTTRQQYENNRSLSSKSNDPVFNGSKSPTNYEKYVARYGRPKTTKNADQIMPPKIQSDLASSRSSTMLNCDCGQGYSSMWLNHYDREK